MKVPFYYIQIDQIPAILYDLLNIFKIDASLRNSDNRDTWVAQLVKDLTSAQVMISRSVGLSLTSGFVLTAQSLEPASDSMSSSFSAPPPLMLAHSLSLSLKNNKH